MPASSSCCFARHAHPCPDSIAYFMMHALNSCVPGLFPAQARGPRSGEADLTQPWLPSPQSHDAAEEAVRAPQDATIAAIGFVAVLIVNVAYVGVPQHTVSALLSCEIYL